MQKTFDRTVPGRIVITFTQDPLIPYSGFVVWSAGYIKHGDGSMVPMKPLAKDGKPPKDGDEVASIRPTDML